MRFPKFLLLALIAAPASCLAADPTDCERSGSVSYPSPDGQWVANVQEEVCAVDNKTAAAITVLLTPKEGSEQQVKRIFSMRVPRSHDYWPRVVWKGANAMEVWAPNRAEIGMHLAEAEGIQITLKYCGDNPAEREQMVEYQAALKKWMQDTTAWVQERKRDPSVKTPRPQRPEEPMYSPDSCEGVGR